MKRRTPEQKLIDRLLGRLSRDLRIPRGADKWRVVGVNHEVTVGSPYGPAEGRLTVELRQVKP